MTSIRRSRRSTLTLRSRMSTLQATVAPASRHTRAPARSRGTVRGRCSPERGHAARWTTSLRNSTRSLRSTASSSKSSQPSQTSKSPGCCCRTVRPPGPVLASHAAPALSAEFAAARSGSRRRRAPVPCLLAHVGPCACSAAGLRSPACATRCPPWGPGAPHRRGARFR